MDKFVVITGRKIRIQCSKRKLANELYELAKIRISSGQTFQPKQKEQISKYTKSWSIGRSNID